MLTADKTLEELGDSSKALVRVILLTMPLLIGFLPWMWEWSFNTTLRVFIGTICACAVIAMVWMREPEDHQKLLWFAGCPIIISAIVYIASVVLDACFIVPPHVTRDVWKSVSDFMFFTALPIFLFSLLPKKPSDLIPGLYIILLLSFVFSIYVDGVFLFSGFFNSIVYGGIDVNKNIAGDMSATGGTIAISLLMTRKVSWPVAIALGLTIIITFLACLGANARTCMLSFPAIAVAIILVKRGKYKVQKIIASFVVSLMVFVASFVFSPKEKVEKLTETHQGSSAAARPYYWALSVEYLSHHPFQPVGFQEMAVADGTNILIDNPCNFFLQEWIQLGLWSALAYTAMILCSFYISARILWRTTGWADTSLVASVVFGTQILRFMREVQDLCSVGRAHGVFFYCAIGITVFLYLGIKRYEHKQFEKLNKEPEVP
jgi:hypothetical protein